MDDSPLLPDEDSEIDIQVIQNLADVVYEQGLERVGAVVDLVVVHPEVAIYAQEGIQLVSICDDTLPEGKVYYHTGAVLDPHLASGMDSLTFEIFRDTKLNEGVFEGSFPTTVNRKTLTDEEIARGIYFLPLTRDNPVGLTIPYRANAWEPNLVPPMSVMSLHEKFYDADDSVRRSHLREHGWLAGSDILQVTARLGEQKQVMAYGSIDRYMALQYDYIQEKVGRDEYFRGMRVPASRSARTKIFEMLLGPEGIDYFESN